jgi:hypothetical protein
MPSYHIVLQASKVGSIGSKYSERREYKIDAPDYEVAQKLARKRAFQEGLEHTLIIVCKQEEHIP